MSGIHAQVHTLPGACTQGYTQINTHTHTHARICPQTNRPALRGTLWATSSPVLPCLRSELPSSLCPPPPPLALSGLDKGVARRAGSQGRVGRGELLRGHCNATWISSKAPARVSGEWAGRGAPSQQGADPTSPLTLWLEASGYPKRGAHGVWSWGWRGVSVGPSVPAGSGQPGQTLRPDAMEKETTA